VEPVASAEGSVDGEKAAKPRKKKGGDAEGEDDRTKLTECEVAPGYVVEAGTVSKGDKLMAFDTEGDFDEDDDEDDEDDEDDGDEEEEEDDDDEDDEEEI
jgi:translation initiation factor eIF-2B subunit gamma